LIAIEDDTPRDAGILYAHAAGVKWLVTTAYRYKSIEIKALEIRGPMIVYARH
jgi:hypothetical protein